MYTKAFQIAEINKDKEVNLKIEVEEVIEIEIENEESDEVLITDSETFSELSSNKAEDETEEIEGVDVEEEIDEVE